MVQTSKIRIGGLALVALAACSPSPASDGEGTVAFTAYGEDYIEREIPSADVEDGWTITYDRFLISIGEVSVGVDGAEPTARMPGAKLLSMKAPGDKHVVTFANIPARPYTRVGYVVGPVTAATELGAGATDSDKELMLEKGYSVYVEGSATKGTTKKTYAWGFTTRTLYDKCGGEVAGKQTDGVVVTNGGTDILQLTIHGDHLYYDDLQSKDAKLRFDNIAAADANADGNVTLEELAAVKLAAIPPGKGTYGTGSAARINDLRAFVEALSRTLGHFRGEGECVSLPR